jgi:hypothetical protein
MAVMGADSAATNPLMIEVVSSPDANPLKDMAAEDEPVVDVVEVAAVMRKDSRA